LSASSDPQGIEIDVVVVEHCFGPALQVIVVIFERNEQRAIAGRNPEMGFPTFVFTNQLRCKFGASGSELTSFGGPFPKHASALRLRLGPVERT
jgi:hypothetical protein